ncbi:MAG: hypothetical protein ACYTF7_09400 [Planctomycetota bacterium]|jgi:hypothetical protein
MGSRLITTLALALSLIATPILAHDSADENAALDYLYETSILDESFHETISSAVASVRVQRAEPDVRTLSPEHQQFILDQRPLIERLHTIARHPHCSFSISNDKGPFVQLPHLAWHRNLVNLVYLDALVRLSQNDLDGALNNANTIMRMANHMNISDSYLIVKLIAVNEFRHAATIVAMTPDILVRPTHRDLINETLLMFPPDEPFQLRESLMDEVRETSRWLRRQTVGKSPEELDGFINNLFGMMADNPSLTLDDRKSLSKQSSLQSYIDLYASLEDHIDTFWKAADEPEDLQEIQDLLAEGALGPLAKQVAPNFTRLYASEMEQRELREAIHTKINQ